MHITGKILVFVFLIPAAAASIWLTARLHVVRSGWTKKTATQAKQVEKDVADNNAKEALLKQKQNELERLTLSWNRHWTDIATTSRMQNKPIITAQVGSNSQLGGPSNSQQPVVYVFRPAAAGGSVYLGAFQATAIQANQAAFEPTWIYRASDKLDISPGNWRYRSMIPAGYSNKISDFHDRLNSGDRKLRDLNLAIAKQNTQATDAKEALNVRLGELQGDPQAEKLDDSPEFSVGYVKAIDDEQTSRNQTQDKLDLMRREVKVEYDRMIMLINENKKLAGAAPADAQPASPAPAKKQ